MGCSYANVEEKGDYLATKASKEKAKLEVRDQVRSTLLLTGDERKLLERTLIIVTRKDPIKKAALKFFDITEKRADRCKSGYVINLVRVEVTRSNQTFSNHVFKEALRDIGVGFARIEGTNFYTNLVLKKEFRNDQKSKIINSRNKPKRTNS